YVELVSTPEQMPRVLETAMRTAILKRGVAVIVLPGNVALAQALDGADGAWAEIAAPRMIPSDRELDRMAALLNDAEAVTLLCGERVCRRAQGCGCIRRCTGGPGRACAARQGVRRMGQPIRRRNDWTDRFQLRLRRDAVLRCAGHARHRFPLSKLLS